MLFRSLLLAQFLFFALDIRATGRFAQGRIKILHVIGSELLHLHIADTLIQGRANGDPVIHGTYTVEYNSVGSHFEYKVDTISSPNYSVSTTGGTPSSSDISYSVSVGAYFEWTNPNDNRKYRVHDSDTLTGHVSY